ncbi:MAG: iron-containing alcohol dehydrogenase [Campylobacteraceae bacterium]|nr:iron-containing alcohol dehydrogenase [Campylobacteraceae bacterium]
MRADVNWNYPTNIRFGHNRSKQIIEFCKELNIKNPLIVTDEGLVKLDLIRDFVNIFIKSKFPFDIFCDIQSNPTYKSIIEGVKQYKKNNNDAIIVIGGGSAIDAGKTIAFMQNQVLDLWEFEDVGDNYKKARVNGVCKIIAIPTTAGTGSEVGRASLITNSFTQSKKIIFHPTLLPSLVILDPNLTYDLPQNITAWTGIDAFVHSLEAYCSPVFHPQADAIALESMRLIKNSLLSVYTNAYNEDARADMIIASMMGATAFQKGLGSTHSIAHQLGGIYNTAHGLANAIILPYSLYQNKDVTQNKLKRICMYLDIKNPGFDSLFDFIINLRKKLDIPTSLQKIGINDDKTKEIAIGAYADPSTITNAKKLSENDLLKLFKAAQSGSYEGL